MSTSTSRTTSRTDGKLGHLARQAPYLFDGRGNLLLPGTLGAGSHVFAVDVTLTDGHRLTTATTAVVFRVGCSAGGAGTSPWRRSPAPRASATRRTGSRCRPGPGRCGSVPTACPPHRPQPTHDLTVGQVRFEPGGRLIAGSQLPNFPHASKGGFCAGIAGAGICHWSLHGHALTVRVVSDHPCAGRNSFWNGRFTR